MKSALFKIQNHPDVDCNSEATGVRGLLKKDTEPTLSALTDFLKKRDSLAKCLLIDTILV